MIERNGAARNRALDIRLPKEVVDRFAVAVRPALAKHRAEARLVIHQPGGEHEFTRDALDAMVACCERSVPRT